MARKKGGGDGGGVPEWLVTFADLMSILVCFFVLSISFSIQDTQKLHVVAGSMRDACGITDASRKTGMIEIHGAPVRDYICDVANMPCEEMDTDFATERHDQRSRQGPEANTHEIEKADKERQFATAAASLRQAWQEMPEIMEISEQILIEEVPEGLNIQLVDQDGRSMFPQGSMFPYERARQLISKLAPVLRQMPNRIAITGHTSSDKSDERTG